MGNNTADASTQPYNPDRVIRGEVIVEASLDAVWIEELLRMFNLIGHGVGTFVVLSDVPL